MSELSVGDKRQQKEQDEGDKNWHDNWNTWDENWVQNEMTDGHKIELTDGHKSWNNRIGYKNGSRTRWRVVTEEKKVGTTAFGTEIGSRTT